MKKGWQTISFGELGRVFNGNSISEAEKKAHFEGLDDGVSYIGTKDVSFDHVIEYDSGVRIPDDKNERFKLAPANAVLVCAEGGSAGRKIAHTDREIYFGNKLFAICPIHPNSSRLIFYYCLSEDFTKQFKGSMAGLIGGVSINKFKELSVPLPPLVEQQRIVGLLDEAFEGIATAKANAEKNLQSAHALFESHLQSVFTQRGPGWVEKPLGEVCAVKDGTHDSPKYVADGIPFVTQKNIREDGLSFEKTKFITQKDHDDFYRRSNAARGDILISMIGANRGMACIVDDERTFSIKNVGLVKQNPSVNQQFLLYFLQSPQAASFVQGASKGGAQEFVGLTELRRFPVPLPSLERQNAFAKTLQSLREETQRLARIYERKLAALEALKKSLLHQAFTGQLQ